MHPDSLVHISVEASCLPTSFGFHDWNLMIGFTDTSHTSHLSHTRKFSKHSFLYTAHANSSCCAIMKKQQNATSFSLFKLLYTIRKYRRLNNMFNVYSLHRGVQIIHPLDLITCLISTHYTVVFTSFIHFFIVPTYAHYFYCINPLQLIIGQFKS